MSLKVILFDKMNKDRSGYRFLGGWRGLRELLPNNLGAFTQVFASLKS